MNSLQSLEPPVVPLTFRPGAIGSALEGQAPPPDYVVSRYADGRVAARYADVSWDWTPYIPSGKRGVLSFEFWKKAEAPSSAQLALLGEMHWVLYLLAWKRSGPTLSYQSLLHYVKTLRAVARCCSEDRHALKDVFSSHERLLDVVNSLPPVHAKHLSGILTVLASLGPEKVGYAVLGAQSKKVLRDLAQTYAAGLQQFPPLPARIYSHVITTLLAEVTAFEQVADNYLELTRRCIANPQLGRSRANQHTSAIRRGVKRTGYEQDAAGLLQEYGLSDYFSLRGLAPSVKGLSAGLARLQAVCRLTIHVFTGMRDEEVGQLPFQCLDTSLSAGKAQHFIVGATTKLNHGKRKAARWVTNTDGARAVALAQRVAKLCQGAAATQAGLPALPPEETPLFISVVYLGLAGNLPNAGGGQLTASKFDFSGYPELRSALQPAITEADLKELEQIDPHRAWRSESKFQVGQPWSLTTHQLRRSLALYAQRSGLVSLPSLRRQLQHLTEEMSRYYARGSAFSDDFIGKDKDHFGHEWREMQPVSSALSYILNVLTSDEVLFGAHGNWVEHRLRGDDGTVLVDRDATLKRFKRGELAYRETLLGGCTSTEICPLQPVKWLNVDCLKGCKNMVGRVSKLDRVIAAQSKLVSSLDPTSPEFRTEQADLAVLIHVRQKAHPSTLELPLA